MSQISSISPVTSMIAASKTNVSHMTVINPAKRTYEGLVENINDFESKLDAEHEIGLRLVSFDSNTVFHITDIGYSGPDIITFYGTNAIGEQVQLIQNISQLNVLLVATKTTNEKANRIGFALEEKIKDDKSEETKEEK